MVSCFHLSLASWVLFSNKVQFSSVMSQKTRLLSLIWHSFTNSQCLLILNTVH